MKDLLTPGIPDDFIDTDDIQEDSTKYFAVTEHFSELETESDKTAARYNLQVLSEKETENKIDQKIEESITPIQKSIKNIQNDLTTVTDNIDEKFSEYRKLENNTFDKPISGLYNVTSSSPNHIIVNKDYVDQKINSVVNENNEEWEKELKQFAVKCASVEKVNEITKVINEIIQDVKRNLVKSNVENTFIRPQYYTGSVTNDSTLTNKSYVDNKVKSSVSSSQNEIESNLRSYLIKTLSQYVKSKDVYSKLNTYSKWEIDEIIDSKIEAIVNLELSSYQQQIQDQLDKLYKADKQFVKFDGSTPFIKPQKGVDAEEDNEFVTLRQLDNLKEVNNDSVRWKTSGPVMSTVGFVEEGSDVPTYLTLQQIMDAIFYGKLIEIKVPSNIVISTSCPIILCIHRDLDNVIGIELYANGTLIRQFNKEEFEEGCVTIDSDILNEDTEFLFRVIYNNGVTSDDKALVKCDLPAFVGTFPYFKAAADVNYDYLIERSQEDKSSNLVSVDRDVSVITNLFDFEDAKLRKIVVALPLSYPDLQFMSTSSQNFSSEAFEFIEAIPFRIAGMDIYYKIYVYKQKLSKLNQNVTFNFIKE